jgi:rSAM/selenodomain-associated transferase 1
MTNDNKCAVIIFARYPNKGKVKTRLAKEIGEESALEFYKSCAENTFAECKKLKSGKMLLYLFYSDVKDKALITKWAGSEFLFIPQTGTTLGEKMQNAFEEVFSNGVKKAVIIGTDIPDIEANLIKDSCDILNCADTVIGPAADGGYYLLGMKKAHTFLFNDIKWSTNSVFAETCNRIIINKLTFFVLPKLIDIDIKDDFIEWSAKK